MKLTWPVKKKTAPFQKRFSAPYRYDNTCKGLKKLSIFIVKLFGKKNKTADKAQFAALLAELAELREAVTNLIGAYERVVSERDALKKELGEYKKPEKGGSTHETDNDAVSGAAVPERL